MASGDAKLVPTKNAAYRVTFPILDADGDLVTGATALDSEVSQDAGTFADCTNEATEIATSSGMYYLDLTASEMNADTVAVIVKTSSSGAKTTVLTFYPQESGDLIANATQVGGTTQTGGDLASLITTVDTVVDAVKVKTDFLPSATAGAAGGVFIAGTNAATTITTSLTTTFTGNLSGSVGSIAAGGITAASLDATVQARLGIVAYGTAQSATGTTLVLASASTFADDELLGAVVVITGGTTGVGQSRVITDYVSTTDTASVDTWTTTPTGTITYVIFAAAPASTTAVPSVNIAKINGVTIVGDGSGTPFNV